jgi:hypothetical protein
MGLGDYVTPASAGGSVNKKTFLDKLRYLGACSPGLEWVIQQDCNSAYHIWRKCQSLEWLLWLICETTPIETQTQVGCDCVRAALKDTQHEIPPDTLSVLSALETSGRRISYRARERAYEAAVADGWSVSWAVHWLALGFCRGAYSNFDDAVRDLTGPDTPDSTGPKLSKKECLRVIRQRIPWKLIKKGLENLA